MNIKTFKESLLSRLAEIAKPHGLKCKISMFDLYQTLGTNFWKVDIFHNPFLVNGKIELRIISSVKPLAFDNMQFSITDPGKKTRITDNLRAHGAFAVRPLVYDSRVYYFPCEEFHDGNKEIMDAAETVLGDYLSGRAAFQEKVSKESGNLMQYLADHKENFPMQAAMAYLCMNDYHAAEKCFNYAEAQKKTWHISIGSRDYHAIFRDYCKAMQQGLNWTDTMARNGLL